MSLPSLRRYFLYLPTAVVLLPMGNFYAFVLRARLSLGHWPEPYHPDPSTLGFRVHVAIVGLGFLAAAYVAPVLQVLVVAVAVRLGVPKRQMLAATLTFACVAAFGLALTRIDPGSFGDWFMD